MESFPKDQVQIVDNIPIHEDSREFAEYLRNAFVEIQEMETGKKEVQVWEDVRNGL